MRRRTHLASRLLLGLACSLVGLVAACSPAGQEGLPETAAPADAEAYRAEIEAWRQDRLERLTSNTGWLTLVGLHWLEEGPNRLGSAPDADVPLPAERAPAFAGTLVAPAAPPEAVRFEPAPGAGVTLGGEPLAGPVDLVSDVEGEPTLLELGSLSFYVIARGERLGLRVRDSQNPARLEFQGIESFPIDLAWRVVARFEPYDPPRELSVLDVTGNHQPMVSPGALVFTVEERTFRLDALDAGEELFLIVGDLTNGKETYGGGRYLDTETADENGTVVVDFNRLYNPPCTFTDFATCPLPPPQNRLDLAIEAGEKGAGRHGT